jgi:non-heme chloroperoxidase
VPGWRVSSYIWTKQLEQFASVGYRVIAIDSRSQGGSTVRQSHNAPEDRAADIAQVIAGMHLTHLVLVGWSQGVQDVGAYVKRFGDAAVDGLVLIDSPLSGGPEDVSDTPGFIKTIARSMARYSADPRAYSDGMMHAIISIPAAATLYAKLTDESMKTPPDVGLAMLVQDLLTTDRRLDLAACKKPVLVVASATNPLLDQVRRMAATLPNAQSLVIDHAAHAVFFDQPGEFARRLEAFVADLDRDTR